jgi:hypothetical protein
MGHRLLLLGSVCLGLGFLASWLGAATAAENSVRAWVSVQRLEGGLVLLRPFCQSREAMSLEYYLLVEKKGLGNSSLNKQAGRVQAEPNKPMGLSTTTVNLGENENCRVQLRIMAGSLLLANEEFWLGPSARKNRPE